MPNVVDYALFAANAYARSLDVVTPPNIVPVPPGWTELAPSETGSNPGVNSVTGFLARAYKKGSEIVIAYSGTTAEAGMTTKDWMEGNIPSGTGFGLGGQVVDAARFYLDISQANPGSSITFTGHSLGGGLASLMAVYFNRPAETFDQAPFGRSAVSPGIYDALKNRLTELSYALPADFTSYVPGSEELKGSMTFSISGR